MEPDVDHRNRKPPVRALRPTIFLLVALMITAHYFGSFRTFRTWTSASRRLEVCTFQGRLRIASSETAEACSAHARMGASPGLFTKYVGDWGKLDLEFELDENWGPPGYTTWNRRANLPLWPGVATAWVAAAWCAWRMPRPRSGCCPGCGYCLTGNVTGTCPECGVKSAPAGLASPGLSSV